MFSDHMLHVFRVYFLVKKVQMGMLHLWVIGRGQRRQLARTALALAPWMWWRWTSARTQLDHHCTASIHRMCSSPTFCTVCSRTDCSWPLSLKQSAFHPQVKYSQTALSSKFLHFFSQRRNRSKQHIRSV